jgi:hypothetical protein
LKSGVGDTDRHVQYQRRRAEARVEHRREVEEVNRLLRKQVRRNRERDERLRERFRKTAA